MICIVCKKRESKTPKFSYCNSCYVKKWNKEHPESYERAKKNRRESVYSGNRSKALARDGVTCQRCYLLPINGKLQVHHIDGNGSNLPIKQQNNNLDNLISLCVKCHGLLEKGKRGAKCITTWARNYKKCIKCNTVKGFNRGNGHCSSCYERTRKKYKRAYYLNNKDTKPYYNHKKFN